MGLVTIRAQALDGRWEVIGADRAPGVWPENVNCEVDEWGPSRATFTLRRDPSYAWPDLTARTPIEIEEDGELIWDGRTLETPAPGALEMNVQCDGWQGHLEDSPYEKVFVHTRLSDWRDRRTHLATTLGTGAHIAAASVGTDGGIHLAMPAQATYAAGEQVGVMLDLGPEQTAKRIVIAGTTSNNNNAGGAAGQVQFAAYASDEPAGTSADNLIASAALTTWGATFGPTPATLTTRRRYLFLVLHWAVAATNATTAEAWVKITSALVFAETAYESGNVSVLKMNQVVTDAAGRCPLLSTDLSGVAAGTFSIPDLAASAPQTAKAYIDSANAFENMLTRVALGRRMETLDRPTTPRLVVGSWPGHQPSDASLGSGQDIYSAVTVAATGFDGERLRVKRVAGMVGRVYARSGGGGGGGVDGSVSVLANAPVTFRKGVTYAIRVVPTISSYVSGGTITNILLGYGSGSPPWAPSSELESVANMPFSGNGTLSPSEFVLFTPAQDRTQFGISAAWTGDATISFDVQVWWGGTIPERRGYEHSQTIDVGFAATEAMLARIGDLWLADHLTTPYRGSQQISGRAVRDILTGREIRPARLMQEVGQLLAFSDQIDPDTGAAWRNGRIVGAAYAPATEQASVTIDNSRASFDALLSRLGAVLAA